MLGENKIVCLCLASFFSMVWLFVDMARRQMFDLVTVRCFTWVASGLIQKYRQKGLARENSQAYLPRVPVAKKKCIVTWTTLVNAIKLTGGLFYTLTQQARVVDLDKYFGLVYKMWVRLEACWTDHPSGLGATNTLGWQCWQDWNTLAYQSVNYISNIFITLMTVQRSPCQQEEYLLGWML